MENAGASPNHCGASDRVRKTNSRIEVVVIADVGLGLITSAIEERKPRRHSQIVLNEKRKFQLAGIDSWIPAIHPEDDRSPLNVRVQSGKYESTREVVFRKRAS